MNTPTPRTDEAWSCFSGYTEPLQDVKDLSHELERELTAMTEQRDRLADALRSLRDCIQETRGKEAYEALRKADEALMIYKV